LLESFAFRRAVCGLQTRGYWNLFAGVANRLQDAKPLDRLAALLHSQSDHNRYPGDEEFARDLAARDVYSMRACHYLLDRLENHETKELTPTATLTIEHVMPQTAKLRAEWREMLGADWKTVHATWVHRLGNLTLTGYNSTYQDRPFGEKKAIPEGFDSSSVRLNKYMRDRTTWTAADIEQRGVMLAERATKIWPPLVVSGEALQLARQDDLRARAAKRSIAAIAMSDVARALFESLRQRVLALDPAVIEVPESHSVVYHAADGDYFMEILPRKQRLLMLLNLELAECEAQDANLRDSSSKKFLAHATQDGGLIYRLHDATDLDAAMLPVRQAYELAAR